MVYIVNDAPFTVEADFSFAASPESAMTELTGRRMIRSFNRTLHGAPSHTWRASFQPYDLLAICISDPNATIESVNVHCPPSLCGADGELRQKVTELAQRIHAVRSGTVWLDDVVVHQALFSANEVSELQKMLAVADRRWSSGRVSDLMSLLDDHWARFLLEHVPTQSPAISPLKPPVAKEADSPKSPTLYQRVRGWLPF